MITDLEAIIAEASAGIGAFLQQELDQSRLDRQLYDSARVQTVANLNSWLREERLDFFSPKTRKTIIAYIRQARWKDLVNAFRQEVRFGTGGIRGFMALDRESVLKLRDDGLDAAILKGTNTINNIVFLKTTAGVAAYGREKHFEKVVIGYDSRIRGFDFARLVAELFLAFGYTVFLFDAPCPYPELTFAIPHRTIKADLGVLISSSHNDYRYNGYKLSGPNGAQFDPEERDEMYNHYISRVQIKDIPAPLSFDRAEFSKVWYLGGARPLSDFDYYDREKQLMNMHEYYLEHIKTFLTTENLQETQQNTLKALKIGYCAFHGAGYKAFPRLLKETGFQCIMPVNGDRIGLNLNELNGFFPAFNSDPGHEQQPDPGDPRAAETALRAFREDYPDEIDNLDILIGTDPDADRCGLVVKVPERQRHIYDDQEFYLMPADDMWTLVIWFRLFREKEKFGLIKDVERRFLTLSHTTTEALIHLARKHGIGAVKSWVGFASMAAATREIWERRQSALLDLKDGKNDKFNRLCHPFVCECFGMDSGQRSFNIGTMEQSNGFSLLGGPPPDKRSLGTGGHVRDKDGTFAGLLLAEIAAWAKINNLTLIEALDRYIYLDPDIGMFMTFYEPDPLDGEYPGIEGDRIKKKILKRVLALHEEVHKGKAHFGGYEIKKAVIYRTGKYDRLYPPSADFEFPDEGVRFYLDDSGLRHFTVRPSGTGNSLRFHVQLHERPNEDNLLQAKTAMRAQGKRLLDALRELLGAPRTSYT
ncbi:MAG: hypothetical protein ACOYVF_01775 [Candidatus Zixiibacteriota bacterium]